jgi:hypothetical protein
MKLKTLTEVDAEGVNDIFVFPTQYGVIHRSVDIKSCIVKTVDGNLPGFISHTEGEVMLI